MINERKSLRARMLHAGITATAEFSSDPPPAGFDPGASSWKVTLRRRGGRRITVPFHMGSAHAGEPEPEDVLDCLLSDASLIENARDFADFASELGYDEDSRKAERTYRQAINQTERLKRFLGEDYTAFVWETERL